MEIKMINAKSEKNLKVGTARKVNNKTRIKTL